MSNTSAKLVRLTDALSKAIDLGDIAGRQPTSGILKGRDLRTIKGKGFGWTGEYRGHNDAGTFVIRDENDQIVTEQSGPFVYTGKNYKTDVLAILVVNNKFEPVFVEITS